MPYVRHVNAPRTRQLQVLFIAQRSPWWTKWDLQELKITLCPFFNSWLFCCANCELHHNMDEKETVVVTGFGPFRQFLENPSWKAAQGLKVAGLGERVDVYIKELPFAVHLGIARGSSVVILEQTGKNSGYRDRDVCGLCPAGHLCVEAGPEKLDSVVNMKAVSKHFQQAERDVIYSRDAGRYLCEFAYYSSLFHGERRAALIHIPSSGRLVSANRLVPLLQAIVVEMLQQLEEPKQPRRAPHVPTEQAFPVMSHQHAASERM
ncbi:pyroglutamyl-peptidase 1 isoform X2 [Kryptolebias marmoratus]|uniref:pyroglutamyl-peptidase 1 isoform X2 n=1 Tax=Kryptolebias marmoratus TaxID=37003 RepID=UPI0007F8D7A6|nr:pyroglutamyl-peptidase 1 isoform X2 [Kryptolebias marmoratus]